MPMCASTINTAHTAAIKAPLRPKSIVCPHRKPLLSPTQGEERGGGPPLHPSLYIFFLSLNPFLLITKFPDPAVQRTGATSHGRLHRDEPVLGVPGINPPSVRENIAVKIIGVGLR